MWSLEALNFGNIRWADIISVVISEQIRITVNGAVRFLENRCFYERALLSKVILSDVDCMLIVIIVYMPNFPVSIEGIVCGRLSSTCGVCVNSGLIRQNKTLRHFICSLLFVHYT